MALIGLGNSLGAGGEEKSLRLAIFGATGGTGLALTRQALEHGHAVRVLVRNPNRMTVTHANLRVVLGNALDRESVTKTLLGSDAALVCLGQRTLLKNTRVVSQGTRLIMEVMRTMGLKRLVFESAFGVGGSLADASGWQRAVFATLLRAPYADKNIIEPEIAKSGLDWTILRPTALTNGPLTGKVEIAVGLRPKTFRISREDVAREMLRAVEEKKWVGAAPSLTGA
ncbi:MAG: SDR family oxidoreductase [Acidobacteriota bacterium]|nr:SDR family oxidoreductase [Acidobacteriota bacterium]